MADAAGVEWIRWISIYFALAFVGTWLARRYALRYGLLDLPGERRSHQVATPRGGGIAIVAAVLVGIGYMVLSEPARAPLLISIALGLALVAGIGWIDDHRPLSPWVRLGVQAIAALLLAWGVWHEGGGAWQVASGFAAAMVLTNVWNFMDGIDGLAASQALIVALGYGLLAMDGPIAALAFALAGACLGFLPFNLPKARIFLGDVGSGAVGFALAAAGTCLALRDWSIAPMLLLPLSAFLIDATLTLAARIVGRRPWWLPHVEHAYQHWARRLRRHGPVTIWYAVWTVAATGLMLASGSWSAAFMMSTMVAMSVAGWMAWAWLRRSSPGIGQGKTE